MGRPKGVTSDHCPPHFEVGAPEFHRVSKYPGKAGSGEASRQGLETENMVGAFHHQVFPRGLFAPSQKCLERSQPGWVSLGPKDWIQKGLQLWQAPRVEKSPV